VFGVCRRKRSGLCGKDLNSVSGVRAGAKFGTLALSPILGPTAPLLERHFKDSGIPVFHDSENVNSCELRGKDHSQKLVYPNISVPPPEIWKGGKPELQPV